MDSRLIFLHDDMIIPNVTHAQILLVLWLWTSRKAQVNPQGRTNVGKEWAEKSIQVMSQRPRTVNRHRWMGSKSAKAYERTLV